MNPRIIWGNACQEMSTSLYCNSVIVKSQNSGVSEWLQTNSAFLSNFPPLPTLAQSWSGTSMHCCQRPLWCFRFLSALSSWLAEEWIKGESELITSSIAKTQGLIAPTYVFFLLIFGHFKGHFKNMYSNRVEFVWNPPSMPNRFRGGFRLFEQHWLSSYKI